MNESPRHRTIAWLVLPLCAAGFIAGRLTAPRPTLAPVSEVTVIQTPTFLPPAPVSIAQPAPSLTPPLTNAHPRWSDTLWQQLCAQPATLARNHQLAALLETLAATDPQRALGLAHAEGNLKLRDTLVQATLRGWASAAPDAAANWALALPDEDARVTALRSVFSGAAAKPDEATRLIQKICQDHPAQAVGGGNALIAALCDAGNFTAAAQLAHSGNGTVPGSIWIAEAYSRWAEFQPEAAAQAAVALTDATARTEALHGIVGGWAAGDPAALTHFLADLPEGGDRGSMIGQALKQWAQTDPLATAQWINDREPSADFDAGIAAVAGLNTVKPTLALNWAESITDARLRSETIASVLHGWLLEEPAAAKDYLATTQQLRPEERARLTAIIAGGENPQP